MPDWKFITNHGAVCALIYKNERITSREIAAKIGITERSVVRILSDLEDAGYIERIREGRSNKYSVAIGLNLRHSFAREVAVIEFLKLFEGKVSPQG